MFRSVRASVVIERIHPTVLQVVRISCATLVDLRVDVLGQRIRATRTGSAVCRLVVSTDVVLLPVGIGARWFLLARFSWAGRTLMNRLLWLDTIALNWLLMTNTVALNWLLVTDFIALNRFVRSPSVLLGGITMSRWLVLPWFTASRNVLLNGLARSRRILLHGLVRTVSVLFAAPLSLRTRFVPDFGFLLDATLTVNIGLTITI